MTCCSIEKEQENSLKKIAQKIVPFKRFAKPYTEQMLLNVLISKGGGGGENQTVPCK